MIRKQATNPAQLDLFAAVIAHYLDGEPKTNQSLYDSLASNGYLSDADLQSKSPVGADAAPVNLAKRRCRWFQQSLRQAKVIERIPNERGTWRAAERDKNDLTKAPPKVVMIGFSTDLGVAMWGACHDVFGSAKDAISCVITSPPYPLARARAYGNPTQEEWVDFVCKALEPLVKRLLPGGSIAINLSNDIHIPGLPSRSLYKEFFTIAMAQRLGMHLMDQVIWASNKPPGPTAWASKQRMQLNTGYEPVLVFCNDPLLSFADNQRVLQPHSAKHEKLIARGGEHQPRVSSDGAFRIRHGSYGNATAGTISKNVLNVANTCADSRRMRKMAKSAGLPVHGAPMPLALAIFLVKWLSRPGDLIADPFGGTQTTPKACEMLGRLWKSAEIYAEFIMQGRFRFATESLLDDEDFL